MPSGNPGTNPGRLEATAPAGSRADALAREKNAMLNTDKAGLMKNAAKPEPKLKEPDVWVKKWVDYSSKYGLGYLLSNGSTGVFFNDSTKIILDPNGHYFSYFERRQSDRQDVGQEHTLTNFPKEL